MTLAVCCLCLAGCGDKHDKRVHSFAGLPFSVTYDAELLSDAAAEKVGGFYQAVQSKNAEQYTKLLCNEFLAYSEHYWKQSGYSAADLMQSYYSDLAMTAKGDFTVTACEITAMEYDDGAYRVVQALDKVSEKLWDKKVSSYLDTCKRVSCNVTLTSIADGQTYVVPERRLFVISYSDVVALAVFDDV